MAEVESRRSTPNADARAPRNGTSFGIRVWVLLR